MKKLKSKIPFDYITIKTTKSRISYGFLTIPISLVDDFPKRKTEIHLINDLGKEELKTFVPYSTKNKESRIYGLKNFFDRNKIRDGDEIVIQILDDDRYKIISEKVFEREIAELETKLQKSKDDAEIQRQINSISKITNKNTYDVLNSEFVRLASKEIKDRKVKIVPQVTIKENLPLALRKILLELYKGKCQVSNFTFTMRNGNPYFEIHHINPYKGNHVKNVLVVSPNIHAQFTFTDPKLYFDNQGWLRKVKFKDKTFPVFQIIDKLPQSFYKEIHQ